MKNLKTWGGKSSFTYEGSVQYGTTIFYGKGWKVNISADHYEKLIQHFRGRVVPCGTSRTSPPKGSLGEWLNRNISKTAIASYVSSILIHEGYAVKQGLSDILFLEVPANPDSLSFLRNVLKSYRIALEIGGKSPFEINSRVFLSFAKVDLKDNTKRGRTNALANIKKAIECRMDELLYSYWLDKSMSGSPFPGKMNMLKEIGLVAPNVLRKINRLRNQLEHEYKEVPQEIIEDYFDVASLYLDSTEKYIGVSKIIMREGPWFSVKRQNDVVNISIIISDVDKPQFPTINISIDSNEKWLEVAKELASLVHERGMMIE